MHAHQSLLFAPQGPNIKSMPIKSFPLEIFQISHLTNDQAETQII